MPTDGSITTWCSDELHNVLGFTDSALASYLVAVAKRKGSSPSAIQTALEEGGAVAANQKRLESFCEALYSKCTPRGSNQGGSKTKTSRGAAEEDEPISVGAG